MTEAILIIVIAATALVAWTYLVARAASSATGAMKWIGYALAAWLAVLAAGAVLVLGILPSVAPPTSYDRWINES